MISYCKLVRSTEFSNINENLPISVRYFQLQRTFQFQKTFQLHFLLFNLNENFPTPRYFQLTFSTTFIIFPTILFQPSCRTPNKPQPGHAIVVSKSLQVHPFSTDFKMRTKIRFYLVTVNIIQIKLTLIVPRVSPIKP